MKFSLLCLITTAVLSTAVVPSQAVEIVDSQPLGSVRTSTVQSVDVGQPEPVAVATTSGSDIHYQLQVLQEEVSMLRGLVEEQAHHIKELKKQRLDDYVDLDRRISQLNSGQSMAASRPPSVTGSLPPASLGRSDESSDSLGPSSNVAATSNVGASNVGDESGLYRQATNLIIKNKDFDGGIALLQSYLANYPSGFYASNAYYWLGQVYLQKNDLEQSKNWFSRLIDEYPSHQKSDEVKYKLGKVYDEMGDKPRAKALLQEVANSNSAAADLARDYLKQHF